jgi:phospho-N-acetylmuramoyl-pentapeptide-transferase
MVFLSFAVLSIGSVNSAHLTDGLDGLASGVTLPICTSSAPFPSFSGERAWESIRRRGGGLFGFLLSISFRESIHGGYGSLFLGGVICPSGFAYNMLLSSYRVGRYIFESLSVIFQVIYFKLAGESGFLR